jgi:hypothetical protein
MNGISISPLPQADTASVQSRAFTAITDNSLMKDGKGKVEGFLDKVKAHWAQALAAFSDRLDYEEAYQELSAVPVVDSMKQSTVRVLLIHAVTQQVLRLSGSPQQINLDEQGVASARDLPPGGFSFQSQAAEYQVRLLSEGLQITQGSTVRTYIANDFVTLGQSRYVLKIVGNSQEASYVHC